MKIYYYVHTGHRIGLDRFRRAAALINEVKDDFDITLLCSDFRIAQISKEFGIENSVGVDVIRNIPQIANHGDVLIFDSNEASCVILEDMRNYFHTFIRVSDDKTDKKEFLLNSGSLIIMKGAFQHNWEHQIPLQKTVSAPRLNLTFRKVII